MSSSPQVMAGSVELACCVSANTCTRVVDERCEAGAATVVEVNLNAPVDPPVWARAGARDRARSGASSHEHRAGRMPRRDNAADARGRGGDDGRRQFVATVFAYVHGREHPRDGLQLADVEPSRLSTRVQVLIY